MNSRDLGLFIARAAVGGTVAAHGFQKLFGWFGGGGPEKTAAGFSKMGFEPAREAALAAGIAEGFGGSLLAIGAATPIAAAAVAGNMAVAVSVHRPNGFFASDGGLEFPGVLGALAASFAFTGPGNISFDRILKHRYSKTWMGIAALAAASTAAATIVQRREQVVASAGNDAESEPGEEGDAPSDDESSAA